jgi:sialic acid synthase SpsE
MKSISIGSQTLSKDRRPFVLAEMACSHDGDIDRAVSMVDSAAKAGVDGIQFQLFSTDKLLAPYHSFYEKVKNLEISLSDWSDIISYAKKKGLTIFVNPLEVDSLSVGIEAGADVLKIHSADISNPHMIIQVAKCLLPVSLSTGGSTISEIHEALAVLKQHEVKDIFLMHGFQAYPTDIEESNLDYMETLEKEFGLLVGYQDHVEGGTPLSLIIPLLAMAKGAVLLEKHITDSRERKGTDFESALEVEELKGFVDLVNDSWAAFGTSCTRSLTEAELSYRKNFKKSIVAARDLEPGHLIMEDDLLYLRADPGFTPLDADKVLGQKCLSRIEKFQTIQTSDIG